MAHTYDAENFRVLFEREVTWLNGFMRNVSRYGKKRALACAESGKTWTYGELNEEADRLANAFLADGVKKSDVVMFMLYNSPEFLFCYLAGHKTGAVSCPVNYRLAPMELAPLLEDSEPVIFVYDSRFSGVVAEALDASARRPARILVCGDAPDSPRSFEAYLKNAPAGTPRPTGESRIYDETTRLYTSGSTNRSKAVPINSINEVFSARDVIARYPLHPEDKTLNLTPWFHRGGLHVGGPTAALYVGCEVVSMREFRPREALELIASRGVAHITGVPSVFRALARAQKDSPADLSALRGLCSMGSPFSRAEILEYRELFTPNILNGYGTTETFVNTWLSARAPIEKCQATGRPGEDDDARLVRIVRDGFADPDDLVARDNASVGEIIVKAPCKSTGCYANNPEMTAKKFYRDFHYTGDIGVWDEDGYITVLSRKDDMIISAGENIYPSQIEAVLNEHPKIAECAVIGTPDKARGEIPLAFVVPLDESLTIAELKEWLTGQPTLAAYKRPRKYKFAKSLPRTATGKIKRFELRKQATGGEPV
ncbi:MAG: AMP-binding protein [Desulfovibrio sp.]|nr:AMP-binding protein [Desulfovibrio sp.]